MPPPATVPPPAAPPPAPPSINSERVVTLKNGSVVRGRVVAEQPGQWLVVEVAGGWQVTISTSQIAPPGAPPSATGAATGAPAADAGAQADAAKHEAFRAGFRFGARVGVGIPYGKPTSDSNPLGDAVNTLAPFMLELGGQITPAFYLGGYGVYARGSPGSAFESACSEQECSVYAARLGLALEVRMLTSSPSPWIGYAVGWSAEEIDVETEEGTVQTAFGGIDIANLSGGVDFAVSRSVILGPFGGVGFSMYLYRVQAIDGVGVGEAVEEPALHGWIQLGVRAALVL
jgi:hypothetical protein